MECRLDDSGEVLVRSPSTMMGYYKDPERTREALTEDGFIRTGDLGEIDEEGRLKITGRAKELFKTSKGKYVAPAPIENRLAAHSQVEAVCVAGANQAQPYALLMLSEDAAAQAITEAGREAMNASFETLRNKVNAQLDPHEQLAFLAVVRQQWSVENGFLTPTLKIKRNAVEAEYAPREADWYASRQTVLWV